MNKGIKWIIELDQKMDHQIQDTILAQYPIQFYDPILRSICSIQFFDPFFSIQFSDPIFRLAGQPNTQPGSWPAGQPASAAAQPASKQPPSQPATQPALQPVPNWRLRLLIDLSILENSKEKTCFHHISEECLMWLMPKRHAWLKSGKRTGVARSRKDATIAHHHDVVCALTSNHGSPDAEMNHEGNHQIHRFAR